MAIANRTCFNFCNQPKARFGLPGYTPGTIAVNVTWMKRRFNVCQTHRSMYPSIFNSFPVIQPVSPKVRHFSIFFGTFWPPWVHPWDNRDKCHMDEKEDSMLFICIASIFNCFPVIQPVSSKVCHFCKFLPPLGMPVGQS